MDWISPGHVATTQWAFSEGGLFRPSSVSGKDGRLAVMCTHLTFPHSRYDERSREAEQDMGHGNNDQII